MKSVTTTTPGRIYFVQGLDGGPIKIGYTSMERIGERLEALQRGSPFELRVLVAIPGTQVVEKRIHADFAHLSLRGEWFSPGPELLRFIVDRIQSHGVYEPAAQAVPCPTCGRLYTSLPTHAERGCPGERPIGILDAAETFWATDESAGGVP